MGKVTWEDTEKDIWQNDIFDTEDECIAEALDFGMNKGDTIVIGDCIPFEPVVNVDSLLEDLESRASDECGEVGDDWNISGERGHEQEYKILTEKVQSAVNEYLEAIGEVPTFYRIENIREVEL